MPLFGEEYSEEGTSRHEIRAYLPSPRQREGAFFPTARFLPRLLPATTKAQSQVMLGYDLSLRIPLPFSIISLHPLFALPFSAWFSKSRALPISRAFLSATPSPCRHFPSPLAASPCPSHRRSGASVSNYSFDHLAILRFRVLVTMKDEPFIKPEPGTTADGSWKHLPMHSGTCFQMPFANLASLLFLTLSNHQSPKVGKHGQERETPSRYQDGEHSIQEVESNNNVAIIQGNSSPGSSSHHVSAALP